MKNQILKRLNKLLQTKKRKEHYYHINPIPQSRNHFKFTTPKSNPRREEKKRKEKKRKFLNAQNNQSSNTNKTCSNNNNNCSVLTTPHHNPTRKNNSNSTTSASKCLHTKENHTHLIKLTKLNQNSRISEKKKKAKRQENEIRDHAP